jgi:hypothetical protein
MKQTTRRPWLQFSLRSLLFLTLVVASFFAGRMSLQRELNRTRALEAQMQRVQAALAAETEKRYGLAIIRVQQAFDGEGEMEITKTDENPWAPAVQLEP